MRAIQLDTVGTMHREVVERLRPLLEPRLAAVFEGWDGRADPDTALFRAADEIRRLAYQAVVTVLLRGSSVPATVACADTLENLAHQLGIDAAQLANTARRFNGFVAAGEDTDFHRGEHRWRLAASTGAPGSLGTIADYQDKYERHLKQFHSTPMRTHCPSPRVSLTRLSALTRSPITGPTPCT